MDEFEGFKEFKEEHPYIEEMSRIDRHLLRMAYLAGRNDGLCHAIKVFDREKE